MFAVVLVVFSAFALGALLERAREVGRPCD